MERIKSMFTREMSAASRMLMVVATLAMVPCIFLPTWRITLRAPQYPEGLELVIYPSGMRGDIREVNILNHYIGMKEIAPDEFPEFRFIPFFILRFLALAGLTALAARLSVAALGWIDFVVFGAVMLYTLSFWLYDFGNNLSPTAPLRIDPFTPNFIGATRVGQFAVESWPAAGAVLMAVAGGLAPVLLLIEWRRAGK